MKLSAYDVISGSVLRT